MEKPNDFTRYELDRDIPQNVWNGYLKKYSDKYVVRRGEDGVFYIKCYFGIITPYSLLKGYLAFHGEFPNSGKQTYFWKKIETSPVELVIMGTEEISFKFKESSLVALQDLLKIKKRVNLSIQERERRKQNMIDFHKKKG